MQSRLKIWKQGSPFSILSLSAAFSTTHNNQRGNPSSLKGQRSKSHSPRYKEQTTKKAKINPKTEKISEHFKVIPEGKKKKNIKKDTGLPHSTTGKLPCRWVCTSDRLSNILLPCLWQQQVYRFCSLFPTRIIPFFLPPCHHFSRL